MDGRTPSHQVCEGTGFVICNLVPRKVDYHPHAILLPYYHANVDSDDVMFYRGGDCEAAKAPASARSRSPYTPACPHTAQPAAFEHSTGVERIKELAVMVDTFCPLELGEAAHASQDPATPGRGAVTHAHP